MTVISRFKGWRVAMLGLVLLAGCMTTTPTTTGNGPVDRLNMVDPHRHFPHAYRDYPSMDERFARNGTWHSVRDAQRLALGQNKAAVVRAIGHPKWKTKDGNWTYDLHLPLDRNNRLVCQFRVYFDENERVQGTLWRRPQCAELATGQLK